MVTHGTAMYTSNATNQPELFESHSATVRWGDGYLIVEPAFPDTLTKKLKYWRRSLDWDEGSMRRIASGQYEELYTVKSWIDPVTNQFRQQLVTLPGFAHRVKCALRDAGWKFTIKDERTPMPEPDFLKAMEGLRDYQVEPLYVALKSGGGIVSCPTGWGKGRLLKGIAAAYSRDTLALRGTPLTVIASPDKDITRKDYEEMVELLPGREVGLIMSGSMNRSDDVQVITLDSLHHINPEDVGVFICDEVHTAASDARAALINKMTKAAKWGVSATPTGRFDGKDLVSEGMFGPIVYTSTYKDAVKAGALVPIKVYWVKCPEPEMGIDKYLKYKMRTGRYRHGVWRNKARNETIAKILRMTPDKQQTLVIMQYLEQMNRLAELVNERTKMVHAETSADKIAKDGLQFMKAVSTAERREIYKKMVTGEISQIMSTYVYKQGVNFPNLSIVIQAGGGGSDIVAKQIPGRESRKTADKEVSYLVDFWHPWDTQRTEKGRMVPGPVHADDKAREKAYTDLGFDQVWIDDVEQLPFVVPNQT